MVLITFSLDTQPRMGRVELFGDDLSLCERQVAATRAKDDMLFGLQETIGRRGQELTADVLLSRHGNTNEPRPLL